MPMPIDYERGDNTNAFWEWQLPLVVALLGVAGLVGLWANVLGTFVPGAMLLALGIVLLVYLPVTIAAMFPVAWFLGITYGFVHTAILKMAAIILAGLAVDSWARYYDHLVLGWIASVLLTIFLFSYFF